MPLLYAPFAEFALLLPPIVLAGAVLVRLRQPVRATYIVGDIGVGPAQFGRVRTHDKIDLRAQPGATRVVLNPCADAADQAAAQLVQYPVRKEPTACPRSP